MAAPLTDRPSGFTVSIDGIDEREWHECLKLFADASVYQTWAYGSVSWGRKRLSHLVLRNGGRVVSIAQFRIVRVPLLATGIAYLRWGPLYRLREAAPDPAALPKALEAMTDEYVRRRGLLLRIVPPVFREDVGGQAFQSACAAAGFKPSSRFPQYRTIRVDVTPSLEQIRKRLDQKWRNQLNRAERNGLQVRGGADLELFDRFAAIYREMLARKQFDTTVDIVRFRRIQQQLPADLKMRVLLAENDGKPMAGLVAATIGDTGIYLLGATSNEGQQAKGSYLLHWRSMELLKQDGCRWYDLGGINPRANPGVYHFKSGFGGQEVCQCSRLDLSESSWSSFSVAAAERLRRALASLRPSLRLNYENKPS